MLDSRSFLQSSFQTEQHHPEGLLQLQVAAPPRPPQRLAEQVWGGACELALLLSFQITADADAAGLGTTFETAASTHRKFTVS